LPATASSSSWYRNELEFASHKKDIIKFSRIGTLSKSISQSFPFLEAQKHTEGNNGHELYVQASEVQNLPMSNSTKERAGMPFRCCFGPIKRSREPLLVLAANTARESMTMHDELRAQCYCCCLYGQYSRHGLAQRRWRKRHACE
jgi:hypothetical protein